jgi:hypothetical protein
MLDSGFLLSAVSVFFTGFVHLIVSFTGEVDLLVTLSLLNFRFALLVWVTFFGADLFEVLGVGCWVSPIYTSYLGSVLSVVLMCLPAVLFFVFCSISSRAPLLIASYPDSLRAPVAFVDSTYVDAVVSWNVASPLRCSKLQI